MLVGFCLMIVSLSTASKRKLRDNGHCTSNKTLEFIPTSPNGGSFLFGTLHNLMTKQITGPIPIDFDSCALSDGGSLVFLCRTTDEWLWTNLNGVRAVAVERWCHGPKKWHSAIMALTWRLEEEGTRALFCSRLKAHTSPPAEIDMYYRLEEDILLKDLYCAQFLYHRLLPLSFCLQTMSWALSGWITDLQNQRATHCECKFSLEKSICRFEAMMLVTSDPKEVLSFSFFLRLRVDLFVTKKIRVQ
jgi:hypothetical protein